MERYLRWRDEGHLSSNGRCFDIGMTVSGALSRFERTGDPVAGSTEPQSAGDGSLMRLAPVPCSSPPTWRRRFAARPTARAPLTARRPRSTPAATSPA
jgi:ADP-ribosyl-[dinitrogen reductase] hydrolase